MSEPAPSQVGAEELSRWFGLSYASFLVLPRVLMQEMSDEWQAKMAALLREFEDEWPDAPHFATSIRFHQQGKLVKTPPALLDYRRPDFAALASFRKK